MNKMIRQLNHEIFDALASRRPDRAPSRRMLQELLKAPAWAEGVTALFPIRERPTCAGILELCAPILNKICPEPPEKGWGPFCYQYICHLMFPRNGFAPEADRCASGAESFRLPIQGSTVCQ